MSDLRIIFAALEQPQGRLVMEDSPPDLSHSAPATTTDTMATQTKACTDEDRPCDLVTDGEDLVDRLAWSTRNAAPRWDPAVRL